jgi:hypothetical protein
MAATDGAVDMVTNESGVFNVSNEHPERSLAAVREA